MIYQVLCQVLCDECRKFAPDIPLDICDPYQNAYTHDQALDTLISDHGWIDDPDHGFFCSAACRDKAAGRADRQALQGAWPNMDHVAPGRDIFADRYGPAAGSEGEA